MDQNFDQKQGFVLTTESISSTFKQRKEEEKEMAIKELKNLLVTCQQYSNYFIRKMSGNVSETKKNEQMLKTEIKNEPLPTKSSDVEEKKDVLELKYFVGNLYKYQEYGVKWLKHLFEFSLNGILADEMGLGKTIQVIALFCNLLENKISGPYLVVAPLATLPNWMSEFRRFAPKLPVILFYGTATERLEQMSQIYKMYNIDEYMTHPIVVTSYNYIRSETYFLRQFIWQYIVVDEGHVIKNYKSKLHKSLRQMKSSNRLILTGTPLQNNLSELWALLNFLLPDMFRDERLFSSLFEEKDFEETRKILEQEQSMNIIATIHGVLQPFVLRRLKCDILTETVPKKEILVYCPLTKLQKDLYRFVLQKNIAGLLGKSLEAIDDKNSSSSTQSPEGRPKRKCTQHVTYDIIDFTDDSDEYEENILPIMNKLNNNNNDDDNKKNAKAFIANVKMANPMMILKKIVNHPFAVHCPIIPATKQVVIDENVVRQSGKMMVLDTILPKLIHDGHKVLLFCTMTQILDFVEDYLLLRDIKYSRLDGACHGLSIRQQHIDAFRTCSDVSVFLISTRAGGLGLNLPEADTVIFFDRDWNPQVDVQAQDRCHRIGQTKPVMVYSLVTKGTIDERIVTRANSKRRLEKVVIKKGKFTEMECKKTLGLQELEELLNSVQNGQIILANESIFTEKELNDLLDRSEMYAQMQQTE